MKRKPNILIICPFFSPNLGGVETHLQFLTDHLNSQKYRVFVLTYRPLTTQAKSYRPFEKKGQVSIWRFWWFGQGWFDRLTPYPPLQFFYIVPGLLFYSLFWMISNHHRVGVVHAHGFAAAFIARVIGLFFPGKRKIVSTHFIYRGLKPGSLYTALFRWVFKGFDRILLISQLLGREFEKIGLNPKKMEVFRYWLDLSEFKPQDKTKCRKKLGLPKAKLTVLFVGRLIKMKGIFEILKAARSLPQDILFVIVGDGPDAQLLKSKAKGINNFLIVGRKSHKEVVDYLGACDFKVLPSLTDDAQPNVVIEALSCGRPVVVTNQGSVHELINASVGVVIKPSAKAIKKAILDFYRRPEKLKKMTAKTRPFALKRCGLKNAEVITDSYHD